MANVNGAHSHVSTEVAKTNSEEGGHLTNQIFNQWGPAYKAMNKILAPALAALPESQNGILISDSGLYDHDSAPFQIKMAVGRDITALIANGESIAQIRTHSYQVPNGYDFSEGKKPLIIEYKDIEPKVLAQYAESVKHMLAMEKALNAKGQTSSPFNEQGEGGVQLKPAPTPEMNGQKDTSQAR